MIFLELSQCEFSKDHFFVLGILYSSYFHVGLAYIITIVNFVKSKFPIRSNIQIV